MSQTSQPTFPSQEAWRARARRLAPYLPGTLIRQILVGEPLPLGKPNWLKTAVLFADLSGFTPLAEQLAQEGPRGAETLNRTLLLTFTTLINAIHAAGGDVCHFHGDAMLVYFPDEDGQAAMRALACAQFMQRLMSTSLATVTVRQGNGRSQAFRLSMRVGVAYGRCLATVLQVSSTQYEFVLAGLPVDQAVAAEAKAKAGEVVADAELLSHVGLPTAAPFELVEAVLPIPNGSSLFHWGAYEWQAFQRLAQAATHFLPASLAERLLNSDSQAVAEHRTISTLFVRFDGLGFEDEEAAAKLQAYVQWADQIVQRFGQQNGRLNRVLTGDKGNHLHIIFGAPVAPAAAANAVRCALTLQAERPSFIRNQQIGLAVGRAFACAVGANRRREYTVVGRVVNLAARLTQHCPPDSVLVDAQTAALIMEEIQLATEGSIQLKGMPLPTPVFRAIGEQKTAVWQVGLDGNESERPETELPPEQLRERLRQRFGVSQLPASVEIYLGLIDEAGETYTVNLLLFWTTLETMLAQGILQQNEEGQFRVNERKLATMQIPESVAMVMQATLDRLPASSQNLLQIGAVAGRTFSLSSITAVLNTRSRAALPMVSKRLAQMAALGLIQKMPNQPELTFRFQQALMHRVIYQGLPFAQRQTIHAVLADHLRSKQTSVGVSLKMSEHYRRADQPSEALRLLLRLAEAAAQQQALPEAVKLLDAAERYVIELPKAEQQETAVWIARHQLPLLFALGHFFQAEALVQHSQLPEPEKNEWLATIALAQGDYVDVQRYLAQSAKGAAKLLMLGEAAIKLKELKRAELAFQKAQLVGNHAERRLALLGLAELARKMKQQEQMDRLLSEAMAIELPDDALLLGKVALKEGQLFGRDGKLAEAEEAVQTAVLHLQPLGPYWHVLGLLEQTAVSLARGKVEAANQHLREAFAHLLYVDPCEARLVAQSLSKKLQSAA